MPAPSFKITDYAHQKRPCFCAKGACLNCCNDVRGIVVDLTDNVPAIGTYPTADGGELEVLAVSLDDDNLAHFIFGATGYPDGGTATQQAPSTICCYRPIGFVEWIIRDNLDVEIGHYFGCVWAGFRGTLSGGGAGKTIEVSFWDVPQIRRDYWFYRDITTSTVHTFPTEIGGTKTVYPLQSAICAATDFFELGNDTTIACDTGAGLDIRATRATDTGLTVIGEAGPTACGNPCAISQEITITLQTSGYVLWDNGTDQITAPDFDLTFQLEVGCDEYVQSFESGPFDISNEAFPDATATAFFRVYIDNQGRVFVQEFTGGDGQIAIFIDPEQPEEGEVGANFEEAFQIGTITCGAMDPTGGTVDMKFDDITDGPYAITYTVTAT